jgi:hypothetical protein
MFFSLGGGAAPKTVSIATSVGGLRCIEQRRCRASQLIQKKERKRRKKVSFGENKNIDKIKVKSKRCLLFNLPLLPMKRRV